MEGWELGWVNRKCGLDNGNWKPGWMEKVDKNRYIVLKTGYKKSFCIYSLSFIVSDDLGISK